ncbi:DUF3164 family protein [Aeromonas sp. FDAARGOS 1402]|uniref:DUF3164 family protein n=1 Tax=Aeromonas sp. FDAARGOS 1402 TaxID=2778051 RepID=UPI00349F65B3
MARWSDGASPRIRALVDHAFRVSKAVISTSTRCSSASAQHRRRRLGAGHAGIADAIQVTGTSQYCGSTSVTPRDVTSRCLDLAKL